MRTVLVILLGALLWISGPAHAQEDLSVIEDWLSFSDVQNSLYHHLSSVAERQLDRREAAVGPLRSRTDWRRRQDEVREDLRDLIGPFPERSPLRARIVDTVGRADYRIEHLIYESVPNFHVTGSLFVPDGIDEPRPAVLYLSGHSSEAYRSETYQHVILNLVQKGFVVLAIDPIGQGERFQYVEPETGASAVGGPTNQHSYVGAQAFLTGRSPAWIFAWDAVRALDYLEERPEVDPDRLGVTGRSGGGTQTAYVAALDERVRAAAPENYITSFQRLLQSIGPQDAEQNIFHGLRHGLDHADLLTARAPKPTLMITTTRDFFSIQGARETAQEVQRAYGAFGVPDHFKMVEDNAGHTSTEANREALYAFFQHHLDRPGSSADLNVSTVPAQALQVTETGQVSTSFDGKTAVSLVRTRAKRQLAALDSARENLSRHVPAAIRTAKSQSGYRAPEGKGNLLFTGRYQRSGYIVEKYALAREETYPIPFLLFRPKGNGPHPGLLYLHPDGKIAEAGEGEAIEHLVEQGYAVLAPDLAGRGATGPGQLRGDSYIEDVSFNRWFASVLTGRSIVGLRTRDLIRLTTILRERPKVEDESVTALARRYATPTLLHAAAFDDRIGRIVLLEPLLSYGSLATHEQYDPHWIPVSVAGALTGYDLPDLAASLAPRPLLVTRPLDHRSRLAGSQAVDDAYKEVQKAYGAQSREVNLQVERSVDPENEIAFVLNWLAKRNP